MASPRFRSVVYHSGRGLRGSENQITRDLGTRARIFANSSSGSRDAEQRGFLLDQRRGSARIPLFGHGTRIAADTDRFLAQADNVPIFGAPGVDKHTSRLHWAVIEAGHSVLFTSATALLAALAKAESEGQFADRLRFYCTSRLLIIDELRYLRFERRSAHLFIQLVAHPRESASRRTRSGSARIRVPSDPLDPRESASRRTHSGSARIRVLSFASRPIP